MFAATTVGYNRGHSEILWKVFAYVEGTYESSNLYEFTSTSQWYDCWGAEYPFLVYPVPAPTISYLEVAAWGLFGTGIHASAWVSPPGFEYTYGGAWEYIYD